MQPPSRDGGDAAGVYGDESKAEVVEAGIVDLESNKPPVVLSDAQAGVQKIEAAAYVWSKWHLIAAYVFIWLIYFVMSTQEVVGRAFNPLVTSTFASHSLTAATYIISSIIAGLSKLPLAKLLDIWGRPQGMALMLVSWIIGFVMMAASNGVEMYCAAQVFFTVGAQGVSYCMTVFISDTSTLQSRALMLAFSTSPYIVTPWLASPMGDTMMRTIDWQWSFGVFAIITPVVVLPLIFLFLWVQRTARKRGLIATTKRNKLTWAAVKRFAIDFDLAGILLLAAGMALLLVPLSIWRFQAEQWRSPMIISFLVIGPVLLVAFVVYEGKFAPFNFVPLHLLSDRNVLLAGIMVFFVFLNSAVWGSYFTSMLMVVWNLRLSEATYISNIYRTGSCFSAIIIGWCIQKTNRFKWVALYYALPLMILGVGLMIHFRTTDSSIGYIVMTQIFVAFAGGPIVIAAELAMMAPVGHQHVAAILAILDLFGSMGTAVGSAVSAAIWTGTFPEALRRHLPAGTPIEAYYSSIYIQLGARVGSPIRRGISLAYGDAQRYMLITSVVALVPAIICVFFWKDVRLSDMNDQVKGNIVGNFGSSKAKKGEEQEKPAVAA